MTVTFDPISTTTLTSANNVIQVSSIPGTFRHLRCLLTFTHDSLIEYFMRFNGVATSNYGYHGIINSGSSLFNTAADPGSSIPIGAGQYPGNNNTSFVEFYVYNYAQNGPQKTGVVFSSNINPNSANASDNRRLGFRADITAPITQISIAFTGGTAVFLTGTTLTLYGLI